jgi:hypothetical protein
MDRDSDAPSGSKLRRALELVYGVEGVTAARVWQWADKVAVGVRGSATSSPADLLRRVEAAVAVVREPDETWEFGMLDDEPESPPGEKQVATG